MRLIIFLICATWLGSAAFSARADMPIPKTNADQHISTTSVEPQLGTATNPPPVLTTPDFAARNQQQRWLLLSLMVVLLIIAAWYLKSQRRRNDR